MNIKDGQRGSGKATYYSGWILHFFGIYTHVASDEIKAHYIDIPVKIDNHLNNERKMVHVVGGFGVVNKTDGAFRPQMSMIVHWDGKLLEE
jgi:hypothetical protein